MAAIFQSHKLKELIEALLRIKFLLNNFIKSVETCYPDGNRECHPCLAGRQECSNLKISQMFTNNTGKVFLGCFPDFFYFFQAFSFGFRNHFPYEYQ